jgi:class 3 adenylate cyclase/tetratricopeptide (TPR) repeat protein/ribosomal protein L40E
MICSQCQSDNPADAVFCDQCGAPLDAICSQCQESNRRGAKFCKKCGQKMVDTPTPSGAISATSGSAPTIAPKLVAEKILATRRFIEGERKQVTVLFADIRGSTGVIENLDPEEVRRHFDPILQIMMEAVHRYEGTVNQVLGDGIMALFGAPVAHEDHAVRACYAALSMQEEIRRAAESGGPPARASLKIGIGINSGEVVVRSITNDLNVDYAALGHTTHLAARMEALAGPGSIMLTADTLREVEGFVEVRSIGSMQVKGFTNPIDAFELVGVTAARNRLQAQAERGLSEFVGREGEIGIFQQFTAAPITGRILALVGEAGMGKSRLVREFIQRHVPGGWKVIQGCSVSYGAATPYLPMIDLLRQYFEVSPGEESESTRAKIFQKILTLDRQLLDAVPPLWTLLDVPLPTKDASDGNGQVREFLEVTAASDKFDGLEPLERRRQILEAIRRLLVRESVEQPLLLVFEDLHWIDSETQACLDMLVENLPQTQIYLLVNYRPGYIHAWASKDYFTRIRVDPLPSERANALIKSLLGDHTELGTLTKLLIRRTDGNPFFIEESIRSLTETGILVGTKGDYRPGIAIDGIRVPNTVRTVLADRVDRLSAAEKQLLQTAAVIGVVVPLRLLQAVTGLSTEDLHRHLLELQAAEFIHEYSLFPELKYSFKHALTTEVVYGALLRERKMALHASVVGALERIGGDHSDDDIEALAHHAFHAELWPEAAKYLQRAGAKATAHSAFFEALSCYERGLIAADHLGEGSEKQAQQIDLHLEARNILFLLGDSKRVAEHLTAAETLTERLGDEQRTARVLNFLNSYYGLAGDPERAIQIGQRALSLGVVQADRTSSTVTNYYLGAAYNKTGQYQLAVDALLCAIQNIGADHRHERFGTAAVLSAICRSHLVQCLAALGRFPEGEKFGQEGVQIGEEADHATSLIHMLCSMGMLYLLKGDLERSIPFLERSLGLCHLSNIPVYVPFTASRLGSAYANVGRIAEALPYLEQGAEDSLKSGRMAFSSLCMASLAEGYLLAERVNEAAPCAARAIELSKQYKERGHEAWALKISGDISHYDRNSNAATAETFYAHASALGQELGMQPLTAHCRLGIGLVYATQGATEKARQEFAMAIEQFRSMEMTHWQNRGEGLLKDLAN